MTIHIKIPRGSWDNQPQIVMLLCQNYLAAQSRCGGQAKCLIQHILYI